MVIRIFVAIFFLFTVSCISVTEQKIIPFPTNPTPISIFFFAPIPTKTITPTWTPLPTIPAEYLEKTIIDLIENNNGCEYPCWWGIKPGETNWQTAKAFLSSFSPQFWQPDDKSFTTVTFPMPDDWSYASEISVNFYERDNVVSSIRAFTNYSIAEILSKYGEPNEIWIEYHEDELFAPHYSFHISLGYFDKGFMISYFRQVLHDDKKNICPYRDFEPEILTDGFGKVYKVEHHSSALNVWNPLEKKTFIDIMDEHNPSFSEFYVFKPLEEITNLDLNEFVNIYKDPNTRTCIAVVQ